MDILFRLEKKTGKPLTIVLKDIINFIGMLLEKTEKNNQGQEIKEHYHYIDVRC